MVKLKVFQITYYVIQSEAKNLPDYILRHSERSEESPNSLINLKPQSNTYPWRSFGLRPLDDGKVTYYVIQSEAKNLLDYILRHSERSEESPNSLINLKPQSNKHPWRSFGLRPLDDGKVTYYVIQSEAKNLPDCMLRHSERSEESPRLHATSFRAKRRISQLTHKPG